MTFVLMLGNVLLNLLQDLVLEQSLDHSELGLHALLNFTEASAEPAAWLHIYMSTHELTSPISSVYPG